MELQLWAQAVAAFAIPVCEFYLVNNLGHFSVKINAARQQQCVSDEPSHKQHWQNTQQDTVIISPVLFQLWSFSFSFSCENSNFSV